MALTKINNNTLSSAGIATGKVLQVVQGSDSTQLSTTSTSLVDVGLSASITPSSSSNKVLIIVDAQGQFGSNTGFGNAIVRGSTVVFQTNTYSNYDSGATQTNTRASYCYLDSPSTTSATTYQLYYKGSTTTTINTDSGVGTITLMEIAV